MEKERTRIIYAIALLILIVPVSVGLRSTRINSGISEEHVLCPSLDFEDVVADVLWLKTIQFLGTVYSKPGSEISREDATQIYSLFHRIVSLKPKFTVAYEYGGLALSTCAPELSISLLEIGISKNPQAGWKLPFYAGVVANQWMKNPSQAYTYFEKVKVFADRPRYVDRFFARIASDKGDLRAALDVWKVIYKTAPNQVEKEIAARSLNVLADRILKESTDDLLKQEAGWSKESI